MGLSIYPAQGVDLSEVTKAQKVITVPSAAAAKWANLSLTPGVYTFTCTSSTIATVYLYDSSMNLIGTAVTSSGTVVVNVGTAVSKVLAKINTGTNIAINITLTGSTISTSSGVLDTISTSGSYTLTNRCLAYLVAVSGGQGGRNGESGYYGGDGGNSGGVTLLTTILEPGTYTATIGAGTGPYPPSQSTRPVPGSTTLTLNGTTIISADGPTNSPAPGGAWGGFRSNGNGGSSIATDPILRTSLSDLTGATTGGGGGGVDGGNVGGGGGGNGGLGYGGGKGGGWGSGFGGGGGGGNNGGGGGNGSDGGIYIMKFFV